MCKWGAGGGASERWKWWWVVGWVPGGYGRGKLGTADRMVWSECVRDPPPNHVLHLRHLYETSRVHLKSYGTDLRCISEDRRGGGEERKEKCRCMGARTSRPRRPV